MIWHLTVFVQALPEIDFEKWGSFGLALVLLIWFVSFLIKQMKYYRKKVEEKEQDHKDEIQALKESHEEELQEYREHLRTLVSQKEALHNERQQETQATVEALKETKRMLQEQLQGYQKTWEMK